MRCWRLGSNLTWDMMTFLTITSCQSQHQGEIILLILLIFQTCRECPDIGLVPGDLIPDLVTMDTGGHFHHGDNIAPDNSDNDDTIGPDNDTVSVSSDTKHIWYHWCCNKWSDMNLVSPGGHLLATMALTLSRPGLTSARLGWTHPPSASVQTQSVIILLPSQTWPRNYP